MKLIVNRIQGDIYYRHVEWRFTINLYRSFHQTCDSERIRCALIRTKEATLTLARLTILNPWKSSKSYLPQVANLTLVKLAFENYTLWEHNPLRSYTLTSLCKIIMHLLQFVPPCVPKREGLTYILHSKIKPRKLSQIWWDCVMYIGNIINNLCQIVKRDLIK